MQLADVSLDDKFTLERGRVLISGTQAMVRAALMQRARDAAAGLNTAGYISGYRGSPLGGLDLQLERAQALLATSDITFEPGLNEDLAATAVWGTQQANALPGAKYDGVFGMWYGKGPGVDRSGDALKHANNAGSSEHGGVLAVFGDDHPGKSSTLAHQSEQGLVGFSMPICIRQRCKNIWTTRFMAGRCHVSPGSGAALSASTKRLKILRLWTSTETACKSLSLSLMIRRRTTSRCVTRRWKTT